MISKTYHLIAKRAESLEEGDIILFISALKDVVKVYQNDHDYFDKTNDENNTLINFLQNQNPTLIEVYKVLKILDLDLKLKLSSSLWLPKIRSNFYESCTN